MAVSPVWAPGKGTERQAEITSSTNSNIRTASTVVAQIDSNAATSGYARGFSYEEIIRWNLKKGIL